MAMNANLRFLDGCLDADLGQSPTNVSAKVGTQSLMGLQSGEICNLLHNS